MIAWLKNEWAATSTHVWLAGAGASLAAYLQGTLTLNQFVTAIVVSVVAIIVPQATPPSPTK